jgi:outer membrane cobalamin receptor/fucose permease
MTQTHSGDASRADGLFITCFAAMVATAFCFVLRAFVIDDWGREFGLSETQKGELLGVGLWPFSISIVLLSLLIDRLGFRRVLWFAVVCHLFGTGLTIFATGYWSLYIGTFALSLGNGAVEAAVNPLVATVYRHDKTKWLNMLHAGWPGGLVLGGLLALAQGTEVDWRWKLGLVIVPVLIYSFLLLRRQFPVSERVASGVSYREMLAEAGYLSALIVVSLIVIEIGRVFDLPLAVEILAIAALTITYAVYSRSPGRPLFIIMLLIMIPLATTELGTDSWITSLMEPQMHTLGLQSGWVLVYTSALMLVLRLFAGPLVHRLSPLGLLAAGSAVAAIGLFALSRSTGLALLGAATLYGLGKSFFWPTSLGFVSEQFPKGGAVTLNVVAGVGMLAVGIVGSVMLGAIQDKAIERSVAGYDVEHGTQLQAQFLTERKTGLFGSYTVLDSGKVARSDSQTQQLVGSIVRDSKKAALRGVAVLPLLTLGAYLCLLWYFKRRGGYRAVTLPIGALLTGSLIIAFLGSSAQAVAQETQSDSEVVVTSSRLPQPPASSSTALEEQQIESQHSSSVLSLLSQLPGVFAGQAGGAGGISEVFLRGAESNFATVLIDGVKVNDSSNARGGGYDFSTLGPDEIQHVEVTRGPLSAVHGSDAMSGVINISTRRPTEELVARARGEMGTDGYGRAFGSLSGPLGSETQAALMASYADFGDAVEGSSQKLKAVQASVAIARSAATSLRGGLRFADRQRSSFADASGGPLFASTDELERAQDRETTAWSQMHHTVNSIWKIDALGALYSRQETVSTPAIAQGVFEGAPATSSDTHFRRAQLTLNNSFDVSPALALDGGIDFQFEAGRRDGLVDLGFIRLPSEFDLHRFGGAVYAEAKYLAAAGLQLYGAGRVETAEDDGTRGSGRLAVQYQRAPSDILLRASFANGYKRPSFYALGDTLVGNRDLKMETSDTFELAVEKIFTDGLWAAGVTAFQSRYENLIDFDFATFRLVNRSQVRIEGVELSTTWSPLRALSVRLQGTFSQIDLNHGQDTLLYRPESYGSMRIDWRPNGLWTLQAQAQLAGRRFGSSVPTGMRTLRSYQRIDISASRKMSARAMLFAALDNALDDSYQQAVGFPNPGVQARVGATLSF